MFKKIVLFFMNNVLGAFVPWIFFSIVYGTTEKSMLWGSAGAIILLVLFNFKELKKRFVLPLCSGIFFSFLFFNACCLKWKWMETHSFVVINSALAVIVLLSMVIGKPFTIQYARESVAEEYWHSPKFLQINWVLTAIWGVLMILMALPSYLLTQEQIRTSWFWGYGFSILLVVLGTQCNHFIPKLWDHKG